MKKYFWAGTTILLVIILIIIVPGIARAAWYDLSWPYRVTITINHLEVDADLTDFPVYIDLSDLPAEFHTNVNSDGGDIRVTQSDGITEVPREVVFYNAASDTGELHFKGTLSSSVDTTFYIYYGNTGASDYAIDATYGAENVWTNNYIAVLHLQEAVNTMAGGYLDSTANDHDGTGVSMSISESSSPLGNAQNFDGVADYIGLPSGGGMAGVNTGTIEVLVKWSGTQDAGYNNYGHVIGRQHDGVYTNQIIGLNGSDPSTAQVIWDSYSYSTQVTSGGVVGDGAWNYVAVGYSSGDTNLYLNAVKEPTNGEAGTINSSTTAPLTIGAWIDAGGAYSTSAISEVRLSNVKRSDSWIAAGYSNQNTPNTFYTVGAEEQPPKNGTVRINNGSLRINNGTVRIK